MALRLLVINYEMDDYSEVLAWQIRLVRQLSQHCEHVTVLTERIGSAPLPDNVHVEVIDRTPGAKWIGWRMAANQHVSRLWCEYHFDAAFIHMAADYAYDLFPALRLRGIPVLVWYAHGTVTWRLHLALWAASRVVTSTSEGFRIKSPKRHIIGQGIDMSLFPCIERTNEQHEIITVSRISRRKRIHLLVEVMPDLLRDYPKLRLRIVGKPVLPDDEAYLADIRQFVRDHALEDHIVFTGFVPLHEIKEQYSNVFLHVNVSMTNSMDKTVLEALAFGCPVLTSNPAFRELLAAHPDFILRDSTPKTLATRIAALYTRRSSGDSAVLRSLITGKHDLDSYADRIISHLHDILE